MNAALQCLLKTYVLNDSLRHYIKNPDGTYNPDFLKATDEAGTQAVRAYMRLFLECNTTTHNAISPNNFLDKILTCAKERKRLEVDREYSEEIKLEAEQQLADLNINDYAHLVGLNQEAQKEELKQINSALATDDNLALLDLALTALNILSPHPQDRYGALGPQHDSSEFLQLMLELFSEIPQQANKMKIENIFKINKQQIVTRSDASQSITEQLSHYLGLALTEGDNLKITTLLEQSSVEEIITDDDDNIIKKKVVFSRLPQCLIIVLQRNIFDVDNMQQIKDNRPVHIPSYFIFPQNCLLANLQDHRPAYNLFGMVVHSGPTVDSGHYIAYAKDQTKNKWYEFNDEMVTEMPDINIQQLMQAGSSDEEVEYQGQMLSSFTPFILFYAYDDSPLLLLRNKLVAVRKGLEQLKIKLEELKKKIGELKTSLQVLQ